MSRFLRFSFLIASLVLCFSSLALAQTEPTAEPPFPQAAAAPRGGGSSRHRAIRSSLTAHADAY